MRSVALDPIGVRVEGLSLDTIDADDVANLQDLLATHGVMIVPGQTLSDNEFLTFLRRFGDIMFSVGETPVDGHPDLNVISNVGRTTPPRSVFHVDTSYVAKPPTYTALRAVQIPAHGGETLFTNQYQAYETLPDAIKDELRGRTITHVVSGLDLGPDDETQADHEVFRRHPRSGRTALYLSTPQRCVAISGMPETEGRQMIEYLYAHSTSEDNILRHTWAPGDVVMWDNGCVLHRADHAEVMGDRVMHRGMVTAGTASTTGPGPS